MRTLDIAPSVDVSTHSLYLCLSDFNQGNFRKHETKDGRSVLVALDFRATCFMPVPFIELALTNYKCLDPFSRAVAEKIQYPHPLSEDVEFLLAASNALVQYGFKAIGTHSTALSILFLSTLELMSRSFLSNARRSALPAGVNRKYKTN